MFADQPWLAADPAPWQQAAFLDAGTPPVYVGFGSMRVPQGSARAAIGACRTALAGVMPGMSEWRCGSR
jgi:hypothetical protein